MQTGWSTSSPCRIPRPTCRRPGDAASSTCARATTSPRRVPVPTRWSGASSSIRDGGSGSGAARCRSWLRVRSSSRCVCRRAGRSWTFRYHPPGEVLIVSGLILGTALFVHLLMPGGAAAATRQPLVSVLAETVAAMMAELPEPIPVARFERSRASPTWLREDGEVGALARLGGRAVGRINRLHRARPGFPGGTRRRGWACRSPARRREPPCRGSDRTGPAGVLTRRGAYPTLLDQEARRQSALASHGPLRIAGASISPGPDRPADKGFMSAALPIL